MLRLLASIALPLLLAACAALGPPSLVYTRTDIAQQAFVDRRGGELQKILRGMEGFEISGPDVGFALGEQRVELAWTARIKDAPVPLPLSLRIAISGTPVLNAAGTGIDLADARVDEVRLPSIPFVSLGSGKVRGAGESLGTLSLLQFAPDALNRDGVLYRATGVELGAFGLRVALVPR